MPRVESEPTILVLERSHCDGSFDVYKVKLCINKEKR
jgi:hypothetical protein